MAEAIKWVPDEGNADVQRGYVDGATNEAFVLTKNGSAFSLANNITDKEAGKVSPQSFTAEADAKAGAEKLLETYSIPVPPKAEGEEEDADTEG